MTRYGERLAVDDCWRGEISKTHRLLYLRKFLTLEDDAMIVEPNNAKYTKGRETTTTEIHLIRCYTKICTNYS